MINKQENIDQNGRDNPFYGIPFSVDSFRNMPFRRLGFSGLKVPNIGLGTWKIGYPEKGDGSRINEKKAFEIFDKAVDLGITLWDTANRYNNASGNSERVIGRWLKVNPRQRRNVILATKLAGTMDGVTPNHCGLSRANIVESVKASLERLQVSYIDLLYFHVFDNNTSVEESLASIEDLVRQGVIRYFGVSNFTVTQLRSYQQVVSGHSIRSRIAVVQNQFDLLDGERPPYQGVLEFAAKNQMSFIAWSPLAKGLLSDRYLNTENIKTGDRLFDEGKIKAGWPVPHHKTLLDLSTLSMRWGITLTQLVIAYMLTLPSMGPIITSSSNTCQLAENAEAGKMVLADDQKEQITAIITKHEHHEP